MTLRIGLVINPVAGIGGPAGLKGSDGVAIQHEAARRGAAPHAAERATLALQPLASQPANVEVLTWDGVMGARVATALGFKTTVLGHLTAQQSCAADTRAAVARLCAAGVDVLLFVGGDGTARDVLQSLPAEQLALGVPAGVKMHSSVFAVTPRAAGEILLRIDAGGLVGVTDGDVRDIDEDALRAGDLRNRHFGTMRVPVLGHFMQHLKEGGRELEPLAQEEIAVAVVEQMVPERCYVLGPGSTLHLVKQRLGLRAALLGIDVVKGGRQLAHDASEHELLKVLAREPAVTIVVSPTRGQGALLGRGNQQLSPAVLRAAKGDLLIVATRGKLASLDGRPLFLDTGDAALDQQLSGLKEVLAGYDDRLLYRVGAD